MKVNVLNKLEFGAKRSLKSWGRVGVSLEGTVDDIGSLIDEIWHNWLIHRSIPWNISGLSQSISVTDLVVLMEDWHLSCSPFSMGIWDWRVLWQNSCPIPPKEVWEVKLGPLVESMIVENDWSLVSKTSTDSL